MFSFAMGTKKIFLSICVSEVDENKNFLIQNYKEPGSMDWNPNADIAVWHLGH